MKTILVTAALVTLPALASAQPSTTLGVTQTEAKAPERTNSINVSPLGALLGNYAVTYEHLFNGSHGLIVEGNAAFDSNSDSSSHQLGGGVGYRWHWRGRQNSGFLGVMVAQSFGSGEVTTTSGGQDMTYEMGVRSTTITGNIGKRWMIGDAFNITLRLGLGWGHHTVTAKVNDQEAKDAETKLNDLLAYFPIGFDGELSVGYTF
jgi:Protein of unknown function (DUF3575)